MTSQTGTQDTSSKVGPATRATRDDVFRELLDVLRSQANLDLSAAAISEFRSVINATVGDYLFAAAERDQQDLWQDEKFKQFATVNVRKISKAARALGGDRPTANHMRAAADEVILHAHDTYCASLPNTIVPPGAVPKGSVCALYIERMNGSAE